MAVYKHNNNTFHKVKKAHKMRLVAKISVLTVFLISLAIGVDWFLGRISESRTVTTSQTTTTVQSASVSVYRTDYFQFQAPEEWILKSSQSSETKFTYLKKDGPLVTERLVVFVDRPAHDKEADIPITHVLPIELVGENKNIRRTGSVGEHCGSSRPDGAGANSRFVHDDVEFVCNSSSTQYNVVVGLFGGNEVLQFDGDNSREVTLTLVYSSLSANQSTGDLYSIVETFSAL